MGADGRAPTDCGTDEQSPPGSDACTDRQAVFERLAATLQTLRDGTHGDDMAAALLRHASGSTALVALVDGGRRAAVYSANARTLATVPFDRHGVDAADAETVWRSLRDPSAWVETADPDWVHPRYRRDRTGERGPREP